MIYSTNYCLNCVKSKKLILICDLDETLLTSLCLNYETLIRLRFPNLDINCKVSDVDFYNYIHVKLRPGVREFLREISENFELHVMSLGSRAYVEKMVSIIDPCKKYFGDRIISRESIQDGNKSMALKTLFPDGDNIVCVIDDSKIPWNAYPGLIHVKPYSVFMEGKSQFATDIYMINIRTLEKVKRCFQITDEQDNYLSRLSRLLVTIHKMYFKNLTEITDNENMDQYPHVKFTIRTLKKTLIK